MHQQCKHSSDVPAHTARRVSSPDLSYRASGVLMFLLSMPQQTPVAVSALAARTPREGRDAVATAVRELIDAGYVAQRRVQYLDGTLGWATAYSEDPEQTAQMMAGQLAELPDVDELTPDYSGAWPAEVVPVGPVAYVLSGPDGDRYTGSTGDLGGRLRTHHERRPGWDRWRAYRCPDRAAAYRVEYALMAALATPENRTDLTLAVSR